MGGRPEERPAGNEEGWGKEETGTDEKCVAEEEGTKGDTDGRNEGANTNSAEDKIPDKIKGKAANGWEVVTVADGALYQRAEHGWVEKARQRTSVEVVARGKDAAELKNEEWWK